MLRDRVRRTKTLPLQPRRKSKVRAASGRATMRQRMNPRSSPVAFTVLTTIVIILLLISSLWYGTTQIVYYLSRVSSPQLTLVLSSRSASDQTAPVWLLAEGTTGLPRHFLLSVTSELTTGLLSGSNWSAVAQQISRTQTSPESRLLVSQALGLPIARIVVFDVRDANWSSVVSQHQSAVIHALRSGSLTQELLRAWLVVRMSEGSSAEPLSIERISSQLLRQNLTAITSKENCPVAILNNSGKLGLASLMGKILEQNGGSVVRVANALSTGESAAFEPDRTSILFHPQQLAVCSETITTARLLLPDLVIEENEQLADQYRASLVLILGVPAPLQSTTAVVPDPRH